MATITTISGAQFDAMPYEEGRQWELVNGELISVPSPTLRHRDIVFEILLAVRQYLRQSRSAGLACADVESALSDNDQIHRGETARSLGWTQPVATDLLPGFSLELASLFA
jgi:hypothetical protein